MYYPTHNNYDVYCKISVNAISQISMEQLSISHERVIRKAYTKIFTIVIFSNITNTFNEMVIYRNKF